MSVNSVLEELRKLSDQLSATLYDIKTDLEQSLRDPTCYTPPAEAVCDSVGATLDQLDSNMNLNQVRRRPCRAQGGAWDSWAGRSLGVPVRGPAASLPAFPRADPHAGVATAGEESRETPPPELSATESRKQQNT